MKELIQLIEKIIVKPDRTIGEVESNMKMVGQDTVKRNLMKEIGGVAVLTIVVEEV